VGWLRGNHAELGRSSETSSGQTKITTDELTAKSPMSQSEGGICIPARHRILKQSSSLNRLPFDGELLSLRSDVQHGNSGHKKGVERLLDPSSSTIATSN
jgi:hypothetical protein